MTARTVHIEGRELAIEETRLDLDAVLFDSSNPRIQFQLDTAISSSQPTQDALGYALTVGNDQYEKLRENIELNGGVVNPVWVVPTDSGFTVIEGNTRLQVYLDLRDKHPGDPLWRTIPAFILPERCSREQINFIRLEAHLFGTTPWDAYEKARELYRLSTTEDYSLERLSALTKLTRSDIRVHIQAFRDMKEKYLQAFPSPGEHQKFSYFVEFRKNADLKRMVDAGDLSLVDFCEWVGLGKFRRGEDVRQLADVLRDPDARQTLLDADFEAAVDQLALKDPGAKSPLFDKIESVIKGIQEMPFSEVSEIRQGRHPRKFELLVELENCASSFLSDLKRL